MLAALVVLAGSSAALVMPRSRSHVVCRMPSLSPLPPALAASDGIHTFTYDSVQRRLPLCDVLLHTRRHQAMPAVGAVGPSQSGARAR